MWNSASIDENEWFPVTDTGLDLLTATVPCPSSPLVPTPQAQAVPSDLRPIILLIPTFTVVNECPPTTLAGLERLEVVPCPNAPLVELPHVQAVLSDFSPAAEVLPAEIVVNEWFPTTLTGLDRFVVELSPIWPSPLEPNAKAASLILRTTKLLPAEACENDTPAATKLGDLEFMAPSVMLPQAHTDPSVFKPIEISDPAPRDSNECQPATDTGLERDVVVPLPNCPEFPTPHAHALPSGFNPRE
jgi:hypothetical protein